MDDSRDDDGLVIDERIANVEYDGGAELKKGQRFETPELFNDAVSMYANHRQYGIRYELGKGKRQNESYNQLYHRRNNAWNVRMGKIGKPY